ncbi:MAG: hypothetical protein PHI35_02020 [Victivallaceae bacterium]|nr:hypothetical protein [Victivallaceae bacterium]
MELMKGIFEAVMLICFGFSWPMSILKTVRTKNPTGKSLIFMWLILVGYAAGIMFKIAAGLDYVIILYILNTLMVAVDLGLTYHYMRKLENRI